MEAFLEDLERSGEKHHPEKFSDFRGILQSVEAHPKRDYFIHKSIILKNLYGVDIMEEAVEICKLRLFLKLAAQVEPEATKHNYGIETLPDIDFNIRAGNTLVGFATYADVEQSIKGAQQRTMDLYGSMEKIATKAADLQDMFKAFRERQVDGDGSVPAEDKTELRKRVSALDEELNQHLAREYGIEPNTDAYGRWRASHQPFHWFVEYYGIMRSGGFAVVIGNPPYVEYKVVNNDYRIVRFETLSCGNLYAFFLERSFALAEGGARLGLIVPISITAAQRMAPLQELLIGSSRIVHLSSYGLRPAALFPGIMQRNSILISTKGKGGQVFTSDYVTWYADERDDLFPNLEYYPLGLRLSYSVPKTNNSAAHSALAKVLSKNRPWTHHSQFKGGNCIYYHNAGGYWIKTFESRPYYRSLKDPLKKHTTISDLCFRSEELARTYLGILNSSLFYFFWKTLTDARHVYPSDIAMFPIDLPLSDENFEMMKVVLGELMNGFDHNRTRIIYGDAEVDQFSVAPCKPIIDRIDTILARHYCLTEEELDFVISYDIKYRMGGGAEDED